VKVTFSAHDVRIRISIGEAVRLVEGETLATDVSSLPNERALVELAVGVAAWTADGRSARVTVEEAALREAAARHPCKEPVVEGTLGERTWRLEFDTRSRPRGA